MRPPGDGRTARLRRARAAGAAAPRPVARRATAYLPPATASRAVARPPCALRRLDPTDPALDARTFGDWLAEHGQSPATVDALWDLVGVATLNLPPAEASLALAAMVFQIGLLTDAGAADIGWRAVPLQRAARRRGADAPRRAPASTSATGTHGRARRARDGAFSARRTRRGRRRRRGRARGAARRRRRRLLPAGAGPHAAELERPGRVADRERARRLRPAGHRRRSSPAVDSPVQWVFDRTRASAACDAASTWPCRCRPPTRTSTCRRRALRAAVPARARPAAARRPARRRRRLLRHPRAARRRSGQARAAPRCGPGRRPRCPACSWPARGPTPAGRRPWRARCAAATAAAARPSAGAGPRASSRRWRRDVDASRRRRPCREPASSSSRRCGPPSRGSTRICSAVAVATTSAGATRTAGRRAAAARRSGRRWRCCRPRPRGAAARVGVPGAVAVELVHNFSLLHDDLMDGDLERRHRPTVWAIFGDRRSAILAGDALLALATRCCSTSARPRRARRRAARRRDHARLIARPGQDMAFETPRRRHASTSAWTWRAARPARCSACAGSIGAVLAGAPTPRVDALAAFGSQLGLAFQLVDDLLGIWGDPAVDRQAGRAATCAQRKKSLPVIAALRRRSADAAGRAARAAGRRPARRRPRSRAAAELVEACGGRRLGGRRGRAPARRSRCAASSELRSTRRARDRAARASPASSSSESLMTAGSAPGTAVRRRSARSRASTHLLGLQDPDGWWKGELETNVTMDAEDLLLRSSSASARRRRPARRPRWIRSQQRADGTWATFSAGRPTCPPRSRPTSRCGWPATRPTRRTCGGRARSSSTTAASKRTRVFTRIWLALFGLWSWDDLPGAAAGADVPAAVVSRSTSTTSPAGPGRRSCRSPSSRRYRPVRPLPLRARRAADGGTAGADRSRVPSWPGAFQRLDRLLHGYERRPLDGRCAGSR